MKNILITIILGSFLLACSSDNSKTEIELGENKEIDITNNCNCDSLVLNNNILELNGESYTGNCILNYPNTTDKYIEKQLLNGVLHGKVTYFNKQGKKLFSETYNNGKALGDLDNQPDCSCNEIKSKTENNIIKGYYKETLYTGKCSDFFPKTKQIYIESNYKDGLLDGYTIYYKKNGDVLMMQNYEEGILIKETHPK